MYLPVALGNLHILLTIGVRLKFDLSFIVNSFGRFSPFIGCMPTVVLFVGLGYAANYGVDIQSSIVSYFAYRQLRGFLSIAA